MLLHLKKPKISQQKNIERKGVGYFGETWDQIGLSEGMRKKIRPDKGVCTTPMRVSRWEK